jgi:hypothetical protein
MYGGVELQLHILHSSRYPLDKGLSSPSAGLYAGKESKIW